MNTFCLFLCALINFVLCWAFWLFNRVALHNYGSLGSLIPSLTQWTLRFPTFYGIAGILCLILWSMVLKKKIPVNKTGAFVIAILLFDVLLLALSAPGYSLPIMYIPVTID